MDGCLGAEQFTCHRSGTALDLREDSSAGVLNNLRKHSTRSPTIAARQPSRWHCCARQFLHTDCILVCPKENTMFYGIGGTILIVLLVLFFLGRL